MKMNLKKPCNDCPFRRNSIRGWLGPWQPATLLMSLAYHPFPCHQTIPDGGRVSLTDNRMEFCAGAAIFLNNKMERSRNRLVERYQDRLENVPQQTKDGVFSNSDQFFRHHAGRPAEGGVFEEALKESGT